MQGAIILDISPACDDDWCGVTTYNSVVPDTGSPANGDIANHHRSRGDKYVVFDGGPDALVREDGHSFLLWTMPRSGTYAFCAPKNLVEPLVVVKIGRIETIDGDAIVTLSF